MAKKGYTGTEEIFEGKEGLMDVYGPAWEKEKLLGGPGRNFKILECSMKAFPTEALSHTHLTTTLKVVTRNNISYDRIKEVKITTIARAYAILFDPHKYRPQSRETADHSLPYCIATALVDHKITTQSFSDEKLKDSRIWEVIDKIKGEISDEFEKMFPAKQPSRVVIKTKDGKEYSEYLEYSKSDPSQPMTLEDLETKFNSLSSGILSQQQQIRIKERIFNCEKIGVRKFMETLVVKAQ